MEIDGLFLSGSSSFQVALGNNLSTEIPCFFSTRTFLFVGATWVALMKSTGYNAQLTFSNSLKSIRFNGADIYTQVQFIRIIKTLSCLCYMIDSNPFFWVFKKKGMRIIGHLVELLLWSSASFSCLSLLITTQFSDIFFLLSFQHLRFEIIRRLTVDFHNLENAPCAKVAH